MNLQLDKFNPAAVMDIHYFTPFHMKRFVNVFAPINEESFLATLYA